MDPSSSIEPESELPLKIDLAERFPGTLRWGNDTDNTLIACLSVICSGLHQPHKQDERSWAPPFSAYVDLVGLSGYAFRVQVHDTLCPSSPDASCGFDCSLHLLKALGFQTTLIHRIGATDSSEEDESHDEFPEFPRVLTPTIHRSMILESLVGRGIPLIAIDLKVCPEWGLILGFRDTDDGEQQLQQDDSSEPPKADFSPQQLLVRTFFDEQPNESTSTPSEKVPWSLFALACPDEEEIEGFGEDSEEEKERRSLQQVLCLARNLYRTEVFDDHYFSGIAAYDKWIEVLDREAEAQESSGPTTLGTHSQHGNWWIFHSLRDKRLSALTFLNAHSSALRQDSLLGSERFDELIVLYEELTKVLNEGMPLIPDKKKKGEEESNWGPEKKRLQIEILQRAKAIENQVALIFDSV